MFAGADYCAADTVGGGRKAGGKNITIY
jgi:hypothetical protein